jgi:hypothetical protein
LAGAALADNFTVDSDNFTLSAPGGNVLINIRYTAAAAPAPGVSFTVSVGQFSGDQGPLSVQIANTACVAGLAPSTSAVFNLPTTRFVPACLVISGLTAGGKYTGSLTISAATVEFKKLTINAAAAQVPTMLLDHQAETRQIDRPAWSVLPGSSYSTNADSVVVLEKSGKADVKSDSRPVWIRARNRLPASTPNPTCRWLPITEMSTCSPRIRPVISPPVLKPATPFK